MLLCGVKIRLWPVVFCRKRKYFRKTYFLTIKQKYIFWWVNFSFSSQKIEILMPRSWLWDLFAKLIFLRSKLEKIFLNVSSQNWRKFVKFLLLFSTLEKLLQISHNLFAKILILFSNQKTDPKISLNELHLSLLNMTFWLQPIRAWRCVCVESWPKGRKSGISGFGWISLDLGLISVGHIQDDLFISFGPKLPPGVGNGPFQMDQNSHKSGISGYGPDGFKWLGLIVQIKI